MAGTCDGAGTATLGRSGSSVLFVPRDGVTTLTGHISPDGAVLAMQELPGMNHAPYRLVFTGKLSAAHITGTYVTPRCRYIVVLNPVSE